MGQGGLTAEPPVTAAPPPGSEPGRFGRYVTGAIFLVPAAIDLDADVQFLTVPLVAGQAHQSELIAIGRGYVVALTIQPMGNLVSLIVKR